MRRWLSLLLALALLAGCGPQTPPNRDGAEWDVDAIAAAVAAAMPQDGLTALDGEELALFLEGACGLKEGEYAAAAVYTASGVDAREAVVVLPGTLDSEALREKLEGRLAARQGDFFGYDPEQAAMAAAGEVTAAEGGPVALVIAPDMAAALAALPPELGGGAVATAPPTPTPPATAGAEPTPTASSTPPVTPSPEVTASTAPSAAPSPEVTATPAPTPTPTPTATPAPSPVPTLDTSGWIPYVDPGDHDMTLWDSSAVLAAWESGDTAGLGEKDLAIYEAAKAIYDWEIAEGMSDFERELALHDALLPKLSYDKAVYDFRTPQGREDNNNPYGALVGGYGICLGYATTFQLLMDMAGVECITVTGASSNSTSSHAWNLVRLEGEWYAVDCTWDDSNDWTGLAQTHRYFNVTSDWLRETNHQWDYENVPEAVGTRFRWDGKGELPT